MQTPDNTTIMNWQDSYTMLYGFISRQLVEDHGLVGERAVRLAIRDFGNARGEEIRNRHLKDGVKINMLSLFTLANECYGDNRWARELQELNPQERASHTLSCPLADIFKKYNFGEIGRMYCEEVHPAIYNHYPFDHGQCNLAKTMSQGDDYCDFNIILRPYDIPDDLKPVCFEEYDPTYQGPTGKTLPNLHKGGFGRLTTILVYSLIANAENEAGKAGIDSACRGMTVCVDELVKVFADRAREENKPLDAAYVEQNFPFGISVDEDGSEWDHYSDHHAKELVQHYLCDALTAQVKKFNRDEQNTH